MDERRIARITLEVWTNGQPIYEAISIRAIAAQTEKRARTAAGFERAAMLYRTSAILYSQCVNCRDSVDVSVAVAAQRCEAKADALKGSK